MTDRLFLSQPEVEELTHRKKYSAQREALNQMGIKHWVRPDGTLAIMVSSLDEQHVTRFHKKPEPAFGEVR